MTPYTVEQVRARQSEKSFMADVVALARLLGWETFHTFDSRRSVAGMPDLLLARPPRILFVEVKREDGKVTPAQRHWLDVLGACGSCEAYTWRPSDWPLVEATLA